MVWLLVIPSGTDGNWRACVVPLVSPFVPSVSVSPSVVPPVAGMVTPVDCSATTSNAIPSTSSGPF